MYAFLVMITLVWHVLGTHGSRERGPEVNI